MPERQRINVNGRRFSRAPGIWVAWLDRFGYRYEPSSGPTGWICHNPKEWTRALTECARLVEAKHRAELPLFADVGPRRVFCDAVEGFLRREGV